MIWFVHVPWFVQPAVFDSSDYCTMWLLAKPLGIHDIISVHFNHFCMWICDTVRSYLYMLTYIYLNVDECWLTSSMLEQSFQLRSVFIKYCCSFEIFWSQLGFSHPYCTHFYFKVRHAYVHGWTKTMGDQVCIWEICYPRSEPL